jgi:hypothetical protein
VFWIRRCDAGTGNSSDLGAESALLSASAEYIAEGVAGYHAGRPLVMADSIDERLQRSSQQDDNQSLHEQLVAAACAAVEDRGAAALGDPGPLAQAAACSPAAVRENFPAHEDLALAVIDDFYRRLDDSIDPAAQEVAAEQIARGDLDASEATEFIDAAWRILAVIGPASLIIRTSENSPDSARPSAPHMYASYDRRWLGAFERAGYSALDATILLAMMISQTKTFALHLRRGEITWEEAAGRHRKTLAKLVRDFASDATSR